MKTLFSLIMMLIITISAFAQNQSDGPIGTTIFPPSSIITGEVFRFDSGLVTQLSTGTDFTFNNSRWFSIGDLTTASQMVYGLRFQLPSRALTFGYQGITDNNPRLQWIGQEEGIGDLEFRVANDFMSTNSDLVATMRNDTGTVFGIDNTPFFDDSKVGILNKRFDNSLEILMEFNSENPTYGVDVHNLVNGPENYGYNVEITGTSDQNFGLNAIMNGDTSNSFGVKSDFIGEAGRAWGLLTNISGSSSIRWGVHATASGSGNSNYGVFGKASGASNNFGIYGEATGTGDFAGFFDGDIGTTAGSFIPSDERLKQNIEDISYANESLMKLKPRVYEYIKSDKINLSQGQQFGFIAQELEEVFPELIKDVKKPVFDKDGNITEYFEYKSVNYIPLIAVLTASVQELTKEVEDLKATNNSYLVYSDRLSSEDQKRLESMAYKLEQNYPNPFSGKSIIEYSLPDNEKNASIMVFDLTGGLLKTFKLSDKSGQIIISSEDFKSGMYLYSLVVRNDEIMTKNMIVR